MAENVGIDRFRVWWWTVIVPVTGASGTTNDWINTRREWLNEPDREGLWLAVWHSVDDEFTQNMEFRFSNANTAMEFKMRWA